MKINSLNVEYTPSLHRRLFPQLRPDFRCMSRWAAHYELSVSHEIEWVRTYTLESVCCVNADRTQRAQCWSAENLLVAFPIELFYLFALVQREPIRTDFWEEMMKKKKYQKRRKMCKVWNDNGICVCVLYALCSCWIGSTFHTLTCWRSTVLILSCTFSFFSYVGFFVRIHFSSFPVPESYTRAAASSDLMFACITPAHCENFCLIFISLCCEMWLGARRNGATYTGRNVNANKYLRRLPQKSLENRMKTHHGWQEMSLVVLKTLLPASGGTSPGGSGSHSSRATSETWFL